MNLFYKSKYYFGAIAKYIMQDLVMVLENIFSRFLKSLVMSNN